MNRISATNDMTTDAIIDAVMAQICIEPKTDGHFENFINGAHKIAPDIVKKLADSSVHTVDNLNKMQKAMAIHLQGGKRRSA
jgi:hypothetical protein